MTTVNVLEAKTHLSRLIAEAEAGGEVIIARGNVPVVRLVPVTPKPKRQFGAYAGEFEVTDAFFEPLPDDELAAWEGN